MPKINPRRPFDDCKPNGYQESLNDWIKNNIDGVEWFLDNAETIREILQVVEENWSNKPLDAGRDI